MPETPSGTDRRQGNQNSQAQNRNDLVQIAPSSRTNMAALKNIDVGETDANAEYFIALIEKKRKETYFRNRENQLKRKKVKYDLNKGKYVYCPCGSKVGVNTQASHNKTLKHKTQEVQVRQCLKLLYNK